MRALILAALLALAAACPALAQPAPMEIAGVRLGADVKGFAGLVELGKVETDISRQYLSTAALAPVPGYRSGYVTFGNCASPGRVARIKVNYADDSRAFYEKLLGALKKRYGEPQQWRGNPFGTLRVWKWSVKDKELGDISLILQHYSGDDDTFTRGNSLRIAAPRLLEAERACNDKKHPEERISKPEAPRGSFDLDYFLPR